jgi:hypothetical protein
MRFTILNSGLAVLLIVLMMASSVKACLSVIIQHSYLEAKLKWLQVWDDGKKVCEVQNWYVGTSPQFLLLHSSIPPPHPSHQPTIPDLEPSTNTQ